MNRKGISPIISAVLLLAVSLAVVGVFSGWAPELAQDITDRTENSTMETMNCNDAALEIRSTFWDGTDTLTVNLRNRGTQDLSDINLVAYNSDGQIIGEDSGVSLDAGNISEQPVTITSGTPEQVEALSGQCGSVTASTTDINQ